MTKSALIAMSGGVDSSVAAWLTLREGGICAGGTMRLFPQAGPEDIEDAQAVARQLGIPHYVFDLSADFREQVMDKFVQTYLAGATPNPCVTCNRCLKFGSLLRRAQELGLDTVVTGHYAQVQVQGGRYLLRKGADQGKDQSYFLALLDQAQLSRARFPLGALTKEQVREIAQEQGLLNARKRDSQDVCFIPDGDCGAFLERYTGQSCQPGDLLDEAGTVLGRHLGAARYTIGQRRGLGTACGIPVYVLRKDMERNTVTVGPDERLYARSLRAGEMNWIAFDRLTGPLRVQAKIRSRHREQAATVEPAGEGEVLVTFDQPQRAISPGQTLALYDGDVVLGGGTILTAEGAV